MLSGSRNKIGVEFCGNFLKIVLLQDNKDRKEVSFLEAVNIKDMPEDKLLEAIHNIIKSLKVGGFEVVLVIPISSVIIKTLQIPSTIDTEIRDILNLQAGRQTPYSRDELIVDYLKLGVFQSVYTKILVVMVTKEIVNKQLDLLEFAGLKVSRVVFSADGAGSFASAKIKKLDAQESTKVLVCPDVENSEISIFGGNGLLFTRNIPLGIKHISEDKQTASKQLTDEIKKSIESYQVEDISKMPSEIYISATEETQSLVSSGFLKDTGMDVKLFELTNYVSIKPPYDKLLFAAKSPSFTPIVSCLADLQNLRIDLVPEEVRIQHKYEEKARKMIFAGCLAMIIFFQICIMLIVKLYGKEKELNTLKGTYKEKIGEANDLRDISERNTVIKGYISGKKELVDVIARIYDLLPDDMYLKGITVDKEGKIMIKGTSKSMSRIFAFVTELENDNQFSGVKTEFTEARKEDGEDVSDFGITMVSEE